MSNIKIENLSQDADLDIEAMDAVTGGGYSFFQNMNRRKLFFGVKRLNVARGFRSLFYRAPKSRRNSGRYFK